MCPFQIMNYEFLVKNIGENITEKGCDDPYYTLNVISQKIDCLYHGKDTLDSINNYLGLFTYMIGFVSLIFLAMPFISYLPNYVKEIRNNFGYKRIKAFTI